MATPLRKVVTGSMPHGIAAEYSCCQDCLSFGGYSLSADGDGEEERAQTRERIYSGDI